MWSKPAAQRIAVALWYGRWRASHQFGGLNVGAFGGGDALILHYNIRRVWIVPEYAPGPRAQCCRSAWRSAASLRYGLVAGGCLIFLGDQMLERLGVGGTL